MYFYYCSNARLLLVIQEPNLPPHTTLRPKMQLREWGRGSFFITMRFKALVFVRLRASVSDAAGNAVMNNTQRVTSNHQPHLLRIGKAIDFWFDAESEEVARAEMDILCDQLFANTVIEDWDYTLEETNETGK